MSTTTQREVTQATPATTASPKTRLFTIIALIAMVVGAGSLLGGIAGAIYTYDQAAVQDITTPDDAVFPEVPVRGPISMWAQSDIITTHQLDRTGGLYYSQMDREAPVLDEAGEPVIGEDGEPVMGPNTERLSWIDATALTTVLGMGILAYALAAFAIAVGATLIALGLAVYKLRNSQLVIS